MSLNLLQVLTGFETIDELFAHDINDDLLRKLLDAAYNDLVTGNYPKELEERTAYINKVKKQCYVKRDDEKSDDHSSNGKSIIYSSFTSAISLQYRVKCNNIGKESPNDYFVKSGNSFIVALRNALIEERGEISDEDLAKELPNFILQFIQEQKLLVNSFPYWRIWSLLGLRISAAIDVINSGGDLNQLINLCGCFDPTSGWGCRMTCVLLIKAMLLNKARESGHYTESDLCEFANCTFYVGCDTNLDLQPMYDFITKFICAEYGLGMSSAKVYPYNCIGNEGLNLADTAINRGINVLITSPPTPLENYSNHDGDSMKYARNYDVNQCDWNEQFLIPFAVELVAKFPASIVFIDGFTFRSNGKKISSDVGLFYKKILDLYPEMFYCPREIGCCYDEHIRSYDCACFKSRCRKCPGCLKRNLCDEPCDQPKPCGSAMIRSCHITGNLI